MRSSPPKNQPTPRPTSDDEPRAKPIQPQNGRPVVKYMNGIPERDAEPRRPASAYSARRLRETGRDGRDPERGADEGERDADDADVRVAEPVGEVHVDEHRGGRDGGDAEGDESCRSPLPGMIDIQINPAITASIGISHQVYLRIGEEVVEADGDVLLEQHGHPEDRQGEEQERQEGHAVVVAAVLAQRGGDADDESEDDGDDAGDGDQLERRTGGLREQDVHWLVLHRDAEVEEPDARESEDAAEPDEIAQVRRHIEVQQRCSRLDELLLVGGRAGSQVLERVAREGRRGCT